MNEKKKKNKDDGDSPGYEDLLDGFALERRTEEDTDNLDGLALAELLGGESELRQPDTETKNGAYDSIAADKYAELTSQFEELDLGALAEEHVSGEDEHSNEEMEFEKPGSFDSSLDIGEEDIVREESMGYAAFLSQMDNGSEKKETPLDEAGELHLDDLGLEEIPETDLVTPSASENILSVVDTAEELPSLEEENPAEEPADEAPGGAVLEPVKEPEYASSLKNLFQESGEESGGETPVDFLAEEGERGEGEALSMESLFGTGEEKTMDESAFSIAEEPSPAPSTEQMEPENDFLGLSNLTGTVSDLPKKAAPKTEVIFEGVEMDFDEQIADVTLAELLLAQGKKKEAADLFMEVSKRKGITHWVAKRIRLLASNP